jgi:hypothetical protein
LRAAAETLAPPPSSSSRLTVDEKLFGSFARSRESRRCHVCVADLHIAGTITPEFHHHRRPPLELCAVSLVGKLVFLALLVSPCHVLRFGENNTPKRAP